MHYLYIDRHTMYYQRPQDLCLVHASDCNGVACSWLRMSWAIWHSSCKEENEKARHVVTGSTGGLAARHIRRNVMKGFAGGRASVLGRMMLCGLVAVGVVAFAAPTDAAGLLKAIGGGPASSVEIHSHAVKVTINNGFSRTEVDQVFSNTGDRDIEAIYTFPLPKDSSLSELSLWIDGREVLGEVVEKERARKIYEEQVAQGNDTALAEKNDFKTFDVSVGRIPAQSQTRVRLVYYQPLEIDLNVGRYLYPMAEGGVDDERIAFWSVDDEVKSSFTFDLVLKSAFPVADLRAPGHVNDAVIQKVNDAETESVGDVYTVSINQSEGARLEKDVIVYYRLADDVPARVELIPYKESANDPGTVMVVVTPAASLKPIEEGTDWIFVLDVSGSMNGNKISTLTRGVSKVLGDMSPEDRFSIVTFNNDARDLTRGFVTARPENVKHWISEVSAIKAGGGTALFAGLKEAYDQLDADRTTGIILVTDGVCNVGPTEHSAYLDLLRKYDIRLFTFVIGNSANQPLMERLALDSGGFAMNISDCDDIVGRLVQAKTKVFNECMHGAKLRFKGEKVYDLTPERARNLYVGQQLVMFGKYRGDGQVVVELTANVSGEAKSWKCTAELPTVDTANPEIERLWAMSRIDGTMQEIRESGEGKGRRQKVVDLALEHSLVTDYTSMLVVREDVMENEQIQRRNATRVKKERTAQQARTQRPVQNRRVDSGQNTFGGRPSPGLGTGPVGIFFLIVMGIGRIFGKRKKRDQ